MGLHVGDDPSRVRQNRQRLLAHCPGLQRIQWLQQVHGVTVVAADGAGCPQADASYTRKAGLACAVMTADCLPLLICDRAGTQVAAVHAGWRGLLDGVIERSVAAFADAAQLLVWLGPAISQRHFEVGAELRERFVAQAGVAAERVAEAFVPAVRAGHYYADLYQLARQRLDALGVQAVYGGEHCSYAESERFFSYRRDAQTGRMVSLIYRRADRAC